MYGSKYNTEMDLLIAKVGQLNQTAEGGKTNWTVSDVQKAIKDAGFSGTGDWYNNYGVQEGFAYTTPTTSTPSASNYAGSKYSTQTALLNAKANSLGMSVNEVKQAIQDAYPGKSTNAAIQQWYSDWGKSEGFATGGITPVNEPFWVGEHGKELMMAPEAYRVVDHHDSLVLAQTAHSDGIPDQERLASIMADSYLVQRHMLEELSALRYRTEKLARIVDKWDKGETPDKVAA